MRKEPMRFPTAAKDYALNKGVFDVMHFAAYAKKNPWYISKNGIIANFNDSIAMAKKSWESNHHRRHWKRRRTTRNLRLRFLTLPMTVTMQKRTDTEKKDGSEENAATNKKVDSDSKEEENDNEQKEKVISIRRKRGIVEAITNLGLIGV
ncbi:hypothetical protein JHK82_031310 [Glycine max]|nr:hypothetical protein JHK85_031962 [Glycine max]KAG4994574.1 hypothetical protein JHK86_031401 [Glycine max]KAG5124573.1 hypothetical protein JHK82_031310 [Glycine max]